MVGWMSMAKKMLLEMGDGRIYEMGETSSLRFSSGEQSAGRVKHKRSEKGFTTCSHSHEALDS